MAAGGGILLIAVLVSTVCLTQGILRPLLKTIRANAYFQDNFRTLGTLGTDSSSRGVSLQLPQRFSRYPCRWNNRKLSGWP